MAQQVVSAATKPFGEILEVRAEVFEEQGLLDMIDLAHIHEGPSQGLAAKAPGQDQLRDPQRFFELTYPTHDVEQTLVALSRRVDNPADVPGTILLNGRYGAGKSHVLLAAHHALTAPEVAAKWAEGWEIDPPNLPDEAVVITRNFIHRTADNLWDVYFEGLGRRDLIDDLSNYPDGSLIQEALGDQPVFLILDELERWYDAVDEETQSLNRNFIQALSEVSHRDGRLTLLTSVLGERQEPAETIRRTKPLELSFQSSEDRERVILFRLFENYTDHSQTDAQKVVYAYASSYAEAGLEDVDEYQARMEQTYPFTPEFLDILIKKVPNLGDFQNTRGTLRFLSKLVRQTHETRPIISSQNIPIGDTGIATTLSNLDASGGEIVRRALGDNYEAVDDDLAHKDELFSAILFYSIADPTHPGATEDDILLAALDPDQNPNQLRDSLRRIRTVAYNLHQEGERYLFKTKENPRARINAVARSPQVTESACRSLILKTLRERWGDTNRTAVYTGDREQVRRELKNIGNNRPKYLLSARSLGNNRALELQNLEERRNLVLLIEPLIRSDRKDASYDLLADDELFDRARRIEACNRLLEAGSSSEATATYRDVRQTEQSKLESDIVDRYGYYVRWNKTGGSTSDVDDSWFELEKVHDFSAARFLEEFRKNFSSPYEIKIRVKELWQQYKNRRASQLIDHFDTTPGEPVPYEPEMVPAALLDLAGSEVLGLQNESGSTYSRDVTELSIRDVGDCVIVDAPARPDPPDSPEVELFTHEAVSAQYDAKKEGVVVSWKFPTSTDERTSKFRTLVQRYTNAKGWETDKEYQMDLDSTLGANRYIGEKDDYYDTENLTGGVWYHYYVFLVEDLEEGGSRAVLSKRCDVEIPAEPTSPGPNVLEVPPQNGINKLLQEAEKLLMSHKHMKSSDRLRKIEFEIRNIVDYPATAKLGAELPVSADEMDVTGQVRLEMRGEYDRQKALKCVRRLPKIGEAIYAAKFYLKRDDTGDGEEAN